MTTPPSIHTQLSPQAFADALKQLGTRRASFVLAESGDVQPSHPALAPIAQAVVQNKRDFDGHEGVFLELGKDTGALLGAFIHKTHRGQGAGGVRHWPYETMTGLLEDGLRLARGMGRKSALAGLWWGGGKGIIARQTDAELDDPAYRLSLYQDYGRFITSLRGLYVTAEDVGTTPSDMAAIYQSTRFVTCVPESIGGSGNPSGATARGVVCAMEAALEFLGMGSVEGKHIAIQGAGNVASFMIGELLEKGARRLTVTDISERALERLADRFADARLVARRSEPGDASILATECDVLAPCALGGALYPETIQTLRCQLVCGAANNQLLDEAHDAALLAERNITYVPDFVANRMGIVQCANEQYGCIPNDPAIMRHFDSEWDSSIQNVTQRVLSRAKETGLPATEAANNLADELGRERHPLWPGRGQDIIKALVAEQWHLRAD